MFLLQDVGRYPAYKEIFAEYSWVDGEAREWYPVIGPLCTVLTACVSPSGCGAVPGVQGDICRVQLGGRRGQGMVSCDWSIVYCINSLCFSFRMWGGTRRTRRYLPSTVGWTERPGNGIL